MTVAICIKCGERKHGALTPCRKCRFDPADTLDRAKSMIVTDHFLPLEDLDGIAERIRTDQPVTFPQDAIDNYVTLFEEQDAKKPRRPARYVIGGLILAVMLVLIYIICFRT